MFQDKESGIEFGINYDAIISEDQKKAVEDFVYDLKDGLDCEVIDTKMKIENSPHTRIRHPLTGDLLPLPSFKDMCKVVKGYEKFYNLLTKMNELNEIMIRRATGNHQEYPSFRVNFRNFEKIYIETYYDAENIQDVIEFMIMKDGKWLPEWSIKEMYKEYLELKGDIND